VIDVRGLEPPEPMVRVLEELKWLQPGQRLEVFHERRPMFLYPQLDDRGFSHETDEPEPGVVRIVIQRQGGAR
jgi:tRNA 2-thiouridine synthesizing protein A